MEIVEITQHRVYVKTRYGEVAVKKLKELGAHWDPETKCWWVGRASLQKVEKLLEETQSQTTEQDVSKRNEIEAEQLKRDREALLGTVEYKDRTYFLVKEGISNRGPYVKLMFRDGSKTFFVDAEKVKIKKRFARPTPLRLLQERRQSSFMQNKKGQSEEHLYERNIPTEEWKVCWECGRSFTRSDARRRGGDWFDSYCGC